MSKKNILNVIHYSVWDGTRRVWVQHDHRHLARYKLTERGAQKVITQKMGKKPLFKGKSVVTSVETFITE